MSTEQTSGCATTGEETMTPQLAEPEEHPNCQAIDRFVSQFKTPVRIARTERLDNERVQDGYTASHMNNETGVGFTVACWTANGRSRFKVFIEAVGGPSDAERFGKLVGGAIE